MDPETLAMVLLELRERTAGDEEAYDAAVDRLREMLGEGDDDKGAG